MSITITQLITYPIKSCAGISHNTIEIRAMGLFGDRQLMLVDENGVFLSQRKYPQMALIQPQYSEPGLKVKAPGMKPLNIDLQKHSNQSISVSIWQDSLQAETLSIEANRWFTECLQMPVNLVKYGQKSHRPIDPAFAVNGETVAFADGYPLLIAHEATLNQLNQHLDKPVDMDRFRPNIVVSSEMKAWQELNWQCLNSEDLVINLVKPCSRCVMTGVDQSKGEQTGTEVLKTLKHKFSHLNKAVFGINGMVTVHSDQSVQLTVGQNLGLKEVDKN